MTPLLPDEKTLQFLGFQSNPNDTYRLLSDSPLRNRFLEIHAASCDLFVFCVPAVCLSVSWMGFKKIHAWNKTDLESMIHQQIGL